jgi:hypothetical protein
MHKMSLIIINENLWCGYTTFSIQNCLLKQRIYISIYFVVIKLNPYETILFYCADGATV